MKRADIVWYNSQTGETQVWYMNGHQLVGRGTVLGEDGNPALIGPPFAIVGIGDMDDDGRADIVWYNSQTGETQVWYMNGHQLVGRGTVLGEDGNPALIGPPFAIVGIGDMDDDGRADIVWYNSQTGETQVWYMNGHQLVGRGTVLGEDGNPALIGPPFAIVGIGDMDDDGRADIVWYNSQTGETQVWYMNGHQLVGRGTVLGEDGNPALIGPPFAIVGIGDMDDDGRADIVWYNSQTGETQVWYMNGHQLVGRGTVLDEDGNPALIGPPFAIVGIGDMDGEGPSVALDHIFVLMLENRSFDHMLGLSGITGTDAVTGAPTRIHGLNGDEVNHYLGNEYRVGPGAKAVMPHDPGHNFGATLAQLAGPDADYVAGGAYPEIDNSGFAASYGLDDGRDPADVIRVHTETQLPFLHQLAREFVVCDNWFASMPGPTWPNRLFVHAATSGGLDHTPDWQQLVTWTLAPSDGLALANGTIYDALDRAFGSRTFGSDHYRIYAGDTFPMAATLDGVSIIWDVEDFDVLTEHLADGTLDTVKVIHIEPQYHDPGYAFYDDYAYGNSQHPLGDVRRGDMLIKQTYEAIRNSPLWARSMLIIVWDEHGGFFDHVAPPPVTAPGDPDYADGVNEHGFTFDQLGPRVPAVIVSPLVPKNLIDHRVFDHASIPATIERLFGLDPMTRRDAEANGLNSLVRLRAPRSTPETLDTPFDYRTPPSLRVSADPAVTRPLAPVEEGDITPFVYSALAQELELSDPDERAAVIERAHAIRTRREAAAYMTDVAARVERARRARPSSGLAPTTHDDDTSIHDTHERPR